MLFETVLFSPLSIIYYILLFVCQSLNNKLVRRMGQQSNVMLFWLFNTLYLYSINTILLFAQKSTILFV